MTTSNPKGTALITGASRGIGAVYVFQRSGDVWTNTATLTGTPAELSITR